MSLKFVLGDFNSTSAHSQDDAIARMKKEMDELDVGCMFITSQRA